MPPEISDGQTNDRLAQAPPAPQGVPRVEFRDDGEPGLIFRVTDKGKRSWSVRYRSAAGEQRRKTIGEFPAVTLAKARQDARKIKGSVAGGADVVADDRRSKAELKASHLRTLAGLAEAYFADGALGLHRPNARTPKRAGTLKEEQRIFDRLVKPEFGRRPVSDIKHADIQAFVTRASKTKLSSNKKIKQAPSNGRHARNIIRQLLSYAVWKRLVPLNEAQSIAVVAPKARERVFTDLELKAIWKALERPQDVAELSLSPEMALALRMALVTLMRGGEVVGMEWSEIDRNAKTWLIPAERMKGKAAHLVPLSDMAMDLLDQAETLIGGERLVFESPRSRDGQPSHLDRRAFSRAMGRVVAALKLPRGTPHDLRRTGAAAITGERIGIPRFVVSQVLSHSGDTGGAAVVTGEHYDVNDYLPEKRRALDAWAALLQSIVTSEDRPSNVTAIAARA